MSESEVSSDRSIGLWHCGQRTSIRPPNSENDCGLCRQYTGDSMECRAPLRGTIERTPSRVGGGSFRRNRQLGSVAHANAAKSRRFFARKPHQPTNPRSLGASGGGADLSNEPESACARRSSRGHLLHFCSRPEIVTILSGRRFRPLSRETSLSFRGCTGYSLSFRMTGGEPDNPRL